jgi:hypothetical protein
MKPEEERKIADCFQALEEEQRQFALEEFTQFLKSQIRRGITGVRGGGFVNYHRGTFQACCEIESVLLILQRLRESSVDQETLLKEIAQSYRPTSEVEIIVTKLKKLRIITMSNNQYQLSEEIILTHLHKYLKIQRDSEDNIKYEKWFSKGRKKAFSVLLSFLMFHV